MFVLKDTLLLYAESPIHAGIGSGLGAVDMPIQRERSTSYPVIQASGVKGALRSSFPDAKDPDLQVVYGPDPDDMDDDKDHAGSISVGDARILLFPVRALKGVFVWITCPDVLARFGRDTGLVDTSGLNDLSTDMKSALVSSPHLLLNGNSILLEEFSFQASFDEYTKGWAEYLGERVFRERVYWRTRLTNHLVILPNDSFRDFVVYSTEVVTRIRIDKATKTVANGALFTQELLPAETLLYSPIEIGHPRGHGKTIQTSEDVLRWLRQSVPARTQIGGDETIGRGLVQLSWMGV